MTKAIAISSPIILLMPSSVLLDRLPDGETSDLGFITLTKPVAHLKMLFET